MMHDGSLWGGPMSSMMSEIGRGTDCTPMSSMMSEIGRTDELDDVRDREDR